jgi:hypothetical protein
MAGDYSMDDASWEKRKAKVSTFLASNDIGEMEQVINWNMTSGDNDEDNRKRYWTSITTLFGMLPNSPLGRGRESDLPNEVQQTILDICGMATPILEALHDDDLMGGLLERHGKSGGGLYETAQEYAEKEVKAIKGRLTKYARNHIKEVEDVHTWDGSIDDNGRPNVVYHISASEAEEEE